MCIRDSSRNYSEALATEIDKVVGEIIDDAHKTALRLLEENIDTLHRAAQILMKKEKLSGPEFRAIMRGEEIDEENIAQFNLFDSVAETEKKDEAHTKSLQAGREHAFNVKTDEVSDTPEQI